MPNFKNLFDKSSILLFGDDHNMSLGVDWLSSKVANSCVEMDFLALEYVETDKQFLIDDNLDQELIAYLQNKYREFPGFKPKAILKLIKSCKAKKIKVVGIEMPEDSFVDWENLVSQEQRTLYLSKKILDLIRDKEKGMGLLGADHIEKREHNVYGHLKIAGFTPISIVFIGGKNWTIDTEDYWIRRLEIQAQKEKKDKKLFFTKATDSLPCDWIIHFPQI